MRRYQEGSCLLARKSALTKTPGPNHLDVGLQTPEPVANKFLLFKPPVYCILLRQSWLTKTSPGLVIFSRQAFL